MKVSLSWLAEYTPIKMDAAALADALTMVGLAVDAVVDRFGYLDSVRVGRILAVAPHPAAGHLHLCQVDVGEETLPIVCGAPNAAAGALAPVALPGTLLPDGTLLAESLIRGQRSVGMLCSAAELALGAEAGGIMILNNRHTPGTPLNAALGLSDPVLELDLTPNRPDCLSIIGVAREVAAIQRTRLRCPEEDPAGGDEPIRRLTSVTIEAPGHCPRYAARLLEGVTVAPSPFWLQDRLLSVGQRPINNIVDVTNFVMLECGQPLHAFDLDRLSGQRIVVRTAAAGERFVTLDRKERTLDADMLMICDGVAPVAVAGVMGGLNSEISENTTRVLIESACFDPASTRRTSKRLGLATEASHRFERGVDPGGTVRAANRAVELMAAVSGGSPVGGVIDAHPRPWAAKPIRLGIRRTNRVLGTRLSKQKMSRLLESVEFTVARTAVRDELEVVAPSFRVDVSRPEDLMEEVARLSGFEAIPTRFPSVPVSEQPPPPRLGLRHRVKEILTGFGFSEVVTYSFIPADSCDRLRLAPDDRRRRTVALLNPLTEDQAVMRPSLIPGLLATLRTNLAQQVRNLMIFEIGKTYIATGGELPEEPEVIAGLWAGSRQAASWHGKETPVDFYDVKGAVEGLLAALKLADVRFTRAADESCRYTRPGHTALIMAGGGEIGRIGEVHPAVQGAYDLKQTAYVFELDAACIEGLASQTRGPLQLPKFPAIVRDITLVVAADVEAQRLLDTVAAMNLALLESAHLFDVFSGGPIASGKKSLSLRLTYRSPDKTLEDEEINGLHHSVTERLIAEFRATLPG